MRAANRLDPPYKAEGDEGSTIPLTPDQLEFMRVAFMLMLPNATRTWLEQWVRRAQAAHKDPRYQQVFAELRLRCWKEKPDYEL